MSTNVPIVRLQSFLGKNGKLMGIVRLDDPRPHKSDGVSAAMPIENAIRLRDVLVKIRGGILR